MNIFEFSNHYDYLDKKLTMQQAPRGKKARFAEFLRIQPAYLSQVLSRKYALSLEQADLANEFFDHSTEESDFFLLLVSVDRAGSARLKKHFEKQIQQILQKRNQLIERLGQRGQISDEVKGIYYSSWVYAAVHVGCTIKRLQTRKNMAQHLNLPFDLVGKILDFLVEQQLLTKEDDRYQMKESWIRLEGESPHIIKHHAHWRQRAIHSLEFRTNDDLHYSGVFSMDQKTAVSVKEELMEFLKSQLKRIQVAPEEELYSLGIDLFPVTNKVG